MRGKPTKQGQIFFAQTLLVNRDETTLKSLKTVGVRPYFEVLLTSIFDIETILSNTENSCQRKRVKRKSNPLHKGQCSLSTHCKGTIQIECLGQMTSSLI